MSISEAKADKLEPKAADVKPMVKEAVKPAPVTPKQYRVAKHFRWASATSGAISYNVGQTIDDEIIIAKLLASGAPIEPVK